MQLESQRGQTMPFWIVGVLVVLTMLFFLANYVNTVAWQVRAQNAADAASSTSLSIQANLWNEETLVLYSAALDEYRIRYLNQALLNTIEGVGCASSCDADYQSLLSELNSAVSGYDGDVQMMAQANNFTEGGQQTDERKAQGLIGTDCSTPSDYTCQFKITAIDAGSTAGGGGGKGKNATPTTQAEYVACKTISYFGPALLKLGSTTTYNVVGRGAAAVLPANTENFNPGTAINPMTGMPFQPTEQWATAYSGPAFDVNFTGLTATLNWYTAATVRPYSGVISGGSYTCG